MPTRFSFAGYTPSALLVEPGESRCVLLCDGGFALLGTTEAGCCSETWFADIIGVQQLLGARIIDAACIELPAPADNRTRQEVDAAYSLIFSTSKGRCELVYRNSSNGYYGGDSYWRLLSDADSVDVSGWVSVTGDWSA